LIKTLGSVAMSCYSHLSDAEREQVGLAKAVGHSIGASAKAIGRPKSTVSRELLRNGMAEAFVRTIRRDYVRVNPCPDAEAVMRQLSSWITHYNEVHPHKALGYRSPRGFTAARGSP
jgi:hypothetical protein